MIVYWAALFSITKSLHEFWPMTSSQQTVCLLLNTMKNEWSFSLTIKLSIILLISRLVAWSIDIQFTDRNQKLFTFLEMNLESEHLDSLKMTRNKKLVIISIVANYSFDRLPVAALMTTILEVIKLLFCWS